MSTAGHRYVDPLGIGTPGSARNALATASMVLGIIAVTTAWLPFLVAVGVVTAAISVALGVSGMRRAGPSGVGRGRAVAGVVMGCSALVASILGVLLTVVVVDVYGDYIDPAAHDVVVTSCEIVGGRALMTGELTNLSDDDAEFSVRVGFFRPGTDNAHASRRVDVGAVAAGATAAFDAQRQIGLDDVECAVMDVRGPLPFGLALD